MRQIDEATFWRLVEWCHRSGATEFTLQVYRVVWDGFHHWYMVDAEVWLPSLAEHRIPAAARLRPDDSAWLQDHATPLWELVPASIAKLRETPVSGIARLQARRRLGGMRYAQTQPIERVEMQQLCLYRDGLPVLGVFEEQGPQLMVILGRDEVRPFRDEGFGPESKVYDDYDLDRFA